MIEKILSANIIPHVFFAGKIWHLQNGPLNSDRSVCHFFPRMCDHTMWKGLANWSMWACSGGFFMPSIHTHTQVCTGAQKKILFSFCKFTQRVRQESCDSSPKTLISPRMLPSNNSAYTLARKFIPRHSVLFLAIPSLERTTLAIIVDNSLPPTLPTVNYITTPHITPISNCLLLPPRHNILSALQRSAERAWARHVFPKLSSGI